MTAEDRALLHAVASRAREVVDAKSTRAQDWQLQTSNSFRRIGAHADGDVLCATRQLADGQPDLLAHPAVLDYIVAAQPRVVLDLIADLATCEAALARARAELDSVAVRLKTAGYL